MESEDTLDDSFEDLMKDPTSMLETLFENTPHDENMIDDSFIPQLIRAEFFPSASASCGFDIKKMEMNSAEMIHVKQQVGTVINSYYGEYRPFFFIMANYFCKLKHQDEIYVPAEISIIKYSLLDGIIDIFHTFVAPKIDLADLKSEAEAHAKQTHFLPLPPNAIGENDLSVIFDNIIDFIGVGNTKYLHYLYTEEESVPIIKSILDYIEAHAGATNIEWHVYPIQYLLYKLKEKGISQVCYNYKITLTSVYNYFAYDFFMHEKNIACKIHEGKRKSIYCSLSYCVRWGYMFSDFLCFHFGINCIPGRHVPFDNIIICSCVNPYEIGHICLKNVERNSEITTDTALKQLTTNEEVQMVQLEKNKIDNKEQKQQKRTSKCFEESDNEAENNSSAMNTSTENEHCKRRQHNVSPVNEAGVVEEPIEGLLIRASGRMRGRAINLTQYEKGNANRTRNTDEF